MSSGLALRRCGGRARWVARSGLYRMIWRAVATLLWGVLIVACGWQLYRTTAGAPTARLNEHWHQGVEICDRHGRTLRELPSSAGVRGQSLPLDEMGHRLVLATLVSEDKRFFDHAGVDPRAVLRAVGQSARHVRVVSGASTVTQQLVKLLDSGGQLGERTVAVKVRETARAQNLEQVLDKSSILEAYLNRLNYGRGLVGPRAAARHYFGVAPHQLSWAQAAFLAVLPRAPSYLDPYRHPQRVQRRQQMLISALHDYGALDADSVRRARSERVVLRPHNHPFRAPHFVAMLRAQTTIHPGETVRTALDLPLQEDVEGLTRTHLARVRPRGASSIAAIVVDNTTGDVLAYVGSPDFFDEAASGQVDMVRARRQPGSTLKPFIYALAFADGHDAAEMVADVPTRFGEGSRAYAPGNFDDDFRGPISAREALAGSLNVPAVRLAAELPNTALLGLLGELGMDHLGRDPGRYGLSLALGSGEVSLRQLAGAYAALARGGVSVQLRYQLSNRDARSRPADGQQVVEPAVAALVTDSLSDPIARIRGLGGRGPFRLGFPVAVKTGTSSGYRDAWCVGYTRERTVAVWVGNADSSPTAELTGGSGAGPVFTDVMQRAMSDVRDRSPLWDHSLLPIAEVCPLSGKPAGPACPHTVQRRIHPRSHESSERCELHRHAARRPGARPGEPPWRCQLGGGERIVVLPDDFGGWLASQPLGAPGRDPDGVPWYVASTVPGCAVGSSAVPALVIEAPPPGSVLVVSSLDATGANHIDVRAALAGTAHNEVDEVEFVLDGELVARSKAPYRASLPARRGDHVLRVRPTDPRIAASIAESRFSVR